MMGVFNYSQIKGLHFDRCSKKMPICLTLIQIDSQTAESMNPCLPAVPPSGTIHDPSSFALTFGHNG
jgi:hypothetical protein